MCSRLGPIDSRDSQVDASAWSRRVQEQQFSARVHTKRSVYVQVREYKLESGDVLKQV